MKNTEIDLTTGKVSAQLIRFALYHYLWQILLQAFYNIADMVIVGRIVGSRGVVSYKQYFNAVFYNKFNMYWNNFRWNCINGTIIGEKRIMKAVKKL